MTGDYDVVVAGGGASGLVAPIVAAREGARTALIECTSCLGGTATAGMVAQWLGFFHGETRVVGGLAMELTRRICVLGGSNGFARYMLAEASANPILLINFPFNPEIVKIASDEAAEESGVDVQLYTQIVRPLLGDGRVEGVVVENASGRAALRAKIVVDATGDAAVAAASTHSRRRIFSTTSALQTRLHSAPDRWICTRLAVPGSRVDAGCAIRDSVALPLTAND